MDWKRLYRQTYALKWHVFITGPRYPTVIKFAPGDHLIPDLLLAFYHSTKNIGRNGSKWRVIAANRHSCFSPFWHFASLQLALFDTRVREMRVEVRWNVEWYRIEGALDDGPLGLPPWVIHRFGRTIAIENERIGKIFWSSDRPQWWIVSRSNVFEFATHNRLNNGQQRSACHRMHSVSYLYEYNLPHYADGEMTTN